MSIAFVVLDLPSLVSVLRQRINGDYIGEGEDIILSFKKLQAERIRQLQKEIIAIQVGNQVTLVTQSHQLYKDRLDEALHKHAQALQDYETLSQEALEYNPFIGSASARPLVPYAEIAFFAKDEGSEFRELDKKGRFRRERKRAFIERLLLGSFGGIMLLALILLMVLHYNRNTALITTSVTTVLFTLVLAVFARSMAGKEVLGAVATYAAVLVVFVGTSIAPAPAA